MTILYGRLGKSTVVGDELEPESDVWPSVVDVRVRPLVVGSEVQRQCREVAWTEALRVYRRPPTCTEVRQAQDGVDLLVQRRARPGSVARVVRDRGRVAINLADAQEDRRW
jgi:hypothetical protein